MSIANWCIESVGEELRVTVVIFANTKLGIALELLRKGLQSLIRSLGEMAWLAMGILVSIAQDI